MRYDSIFAYGWLIGPRQVWFHRKHSCRRNCELISTCRNCLEVQNNARFTCAFIMKARLAGDVLSSLFDLRWLYHQGSYERACYVLQLCEREKGLQTGATDCGSVHRNSWGCSSGLSGDDITWQVYIWLISRSHSPASGPWHVLSLVQATWPGRMVWWGWGGGKKEGVPELWPWILVVALCYTRWEGGELREGEAVDAVLLFSVFFDGCALCLGLLSVKRMQTLCVLYMTAVRWDTKGN